MRGTTEERRQRREACDRERERLQEHLAEWIDPLMAALGIIAVGLLLVQYAANLTAQQQVWVGRVQTVIWVIFIVEFVFELALAPRKLRYLRDHWVTAIAVLLPALRVLRVLRAAAALRTLHLLGLLGGANRAMAALRAMLRGRQFGYLVALTVLVIAIGTVGGYSFEHDEPNGTIKTLGDALWWSACLVTTINNELYPVSPEGEVLGILLRLYALSVIGILVANVASFFVGQQAGQADEGQQTATAASASLDELVAEVRRLREEVGRLTAQQAAPADYRPAEKE